MVGQQAVSFRELIRGAADADLRNLLDSITLEVVQNVRPDAAKDKGLRQLVASTTNAKDCIRDARRRSALFNLLTVNQAKLLLARLGVPPGNDPHRALEVEVPAYSGSVLSAVEEFFGVAEQEEPRGNKESTVRVARPNYPLFRHQRQAMRKVQRALYGEEKRVVLHMPTGSGKTRTAMNIVAEHLRANEGAVVVWLAYSEELLEQAAQEFSLAWAFLGNREVELVRFWGTRTGDLSTVEDGVIVAGLGKLYASVRQDLSLIPRIGDKASLVVIDEAHQSIARTYSYVLDILSAKRPGTALLGLTATPGRSYQDIAADSELSGYWGRTKVTLEVEGHQNVLQYLIDAEYLAMPRFRLIQVAAIGSSSSPAMADPESLDLAAEQLVALESCAAWNLAVFDAVRELITRHRRIIVFATGVRQAIGLAGALRAVDVHARAVTGGTPPSERESILQQYLNNSVTPMVLLNYGVLTTGFDAPATSAAVIARPTRSLVLYSQMVGRAMRGRRAGGNPECEIVTVVDPDLPGFGDPAEAFLNWEDVWRKVPDGES